MITKHWVGLDVGTQQTSICVTDDAGRIVSEHVCDSAPSVIAEHLAQFEIQAVGLETGVSAYLTRRLRAAGFPVLMFDAYKASRYLAIRRNKTDKNDARGLAEIARLGQDTVTQVLLRGPECQSIRSKLQLRRGLVQHRITAENMLRTMLRMHGRSLPKSFSCDRLKDNVLTLINEICLDTDNIDLSADLLPLVDFCISIRRYFQTLDNEMARLARASEVCRRLMTVPGVGPICALSFYSTIENPWRFDRIKDVGAYLGLNPLVRETGGRSSRGKISKAGDSVTRANLYIAARVAMSNGYRECALTDWAKAVTDRIGTTRGRVALARKLAIVLTAVWKSGSTFEAYPSLLPREASPESR